MLTTKDQFIGLIDRQVISVDVPEWGDSVFLKAFGGRERMLFERALSSAAKNENMLRELAAVLSLCDQSGNLLFTPEEAPAFTQRNGRALDRILDAVWEFNRVGQEHKEAEKKTS